jgi:cysteinyl-tRNA synthetase
VRILKEKGYTYQTTDGIYFDTAKFPAYADFAHLDLAAQKAGARVEDNPDKHQPWDFALWKFTPAELNRDMEWAEPVRPGNYHADASHLNRSRLHRLT